VSTAPSLVYAVDGCEVWHGDCLDLETLPAVLQGRRVSLLHVDAPYSEKTHAGHRDGKLTADRAAQFGDPGGTAIQRYAARRPDRADIEYAFWAPGDVATFCNLTLPHVDGWATTITDHVLAPDWGTSFGESGRYVFQPLPWVEIGSRVRMLGDGPSSWACQLVVARPPKAPYSKWGTLPGAYVGPAENAQNRPERITGGKSLALTVALLSDYSRRGDTVLDPCLGGGTTALAARMSGRRCIGVERDQVRAELCARLLGTKREQLAMFEAVAQLDVPGG
jgi:hypothetical protein